MSISTEIGKTQLSLSYTSKTQRPSYDDLDGTVNYVNRLTLESGNPYLSPMKIHSVELMGAWKQFFAKISYEHRKDAFIQTTKSYCEDGEVKLITMENIPKIDELQAFVGAQFKVGIWEPKVNAGIIKSGSQASIWVNANPLTILWESYSSKMLSICLETFG